MRKFIPWVRTVVEVLILALVVLVVAPQAQTALSRSIAWFETGRLVFSAVAPSAVVAGTGASITTSNGATTFRVNVGTGGTVTTAVVTMPVAASNWNCTVTDQTHALFVLQTGGGSGSVQVQSFAVGAANSSVVFNASDILAFQCTAE